MGRRAASLQRADLFDDRTSQAWIVSLTMWRSIIEVRPIMPGTDLMRAYLLELMRYHDSGWRLENFTAFQSRFYVTKAGEQRREVVITTRDPNEPAEMVNVMEIVAGKERFY
jgi:hypothetical protein